MVDLNEMWDYHLSEDDRRLLTDEPDGRFGEAVYERVGDPWLVGFRVEAHLAYQLSASVIPFVRDRAIERWERERENTLVLTPEGKAARDRLQSWIDDAPLGGATDDAMP